MFQSLSKFTFILWGLLFSLTLGVARAGQITGVVRDRQTQEPIIGANIQVEGTALGSVTDNDGKFQILDVPLGTHSIRVRAMGYVERILSEIDVRVAHTPHLNVQLEPVVLEAQEMVVIASPFQQSPEMSTSATKFTQEEIRRAPGAREDLSRAVQIIPGVQVSSDDRNDLIVRGGAPMEVLFRIDGFEFPNPNHFGTQGSTGGPIGMINNDFVQDIGFLSGGFPARFGDKASAIIDVHYRDGSPKFQGSAYLGFSGAGGAIEGGLGKTKGTYLFSARKSYLDLFADLLLFEGIPKYEDYQYKWTIPISDRLQISSLGIYGKSKIFINPKFDDEDVVFHEKVDMLNQNGVVGLRATYLFPKLGFTQFILSHNRAQFNNRVDTLESVTTEQYHLFHRDKNTEWETDFRNEYTFRLTPRTELNTGLQVKQVGYTYKMDTYEPRSAFRLPPPTVPDTVFHHHLDRTEQSMKYAGYLSVIHTLSPFWQVQLGTRYDYFDFNQFQSLSPRASITYRWSAKTKWSMSYGHFYQTPPLILMSFIPENRKLKNYYAEHLVLGMEHLFTPHTRMSLEVYGKKYRQVPVAIDEQRWTSIVNAGTSYGTIMMWNQLENSGTAESYGVEWMLQKKLAEKIYGTSSITWARTFYLPKDGIQRSSNFDTPLIINLVGGYIPNPKYQFSMKWTYSSGSPTTPLDLAASNAYNYPILDTTKINTVRKKAYHRLDLRYDSRTYFKGWNLVSWFSIENVYNRKNLLLTYWNRKKKEPVHIHQIGFFPVGGFTVEW